MVGPVYVREADRGGRRGRVVGVVELVNGEMDGCLLNSRHAWPFAATEKLRLSANGGEARALRARSEEERWWTIPRWKEPVEAGGVAYTDTLCSIS